VALTRCTVLDPTRHSRAVLRIPFPLASRARIASSVFGSIRARPIGFPLLVPFSRALAKEHIARVFDTMERADWHIYQVLTKRSSLLQKFTNERYKTRTAPAHMWFGVSVENAQATSRITHLKKTKAAIRFLSVEPLIGPMGKLDLSGIDQMQEKLTASNPDETARIPFPRKPQLTQPNLPEQTAKAGAPCLQGGRRVVSTSVTGYAPSNCRM
jgi:hypothetical protein